MAIKFLDAHESVAGQDSADWQMDNFNNLKGRAAAFDILKSRTFSDEEFFELAKSHLAAGILKVNNMEVEK